MQCFIKINDEITVIVLYVENVVLRCVHDFGLL